MSLIEQLMRGCVYTPKRWSGDCGEMSSVDESKTDELLEQAAQRLSELETALKRIRDCDCVITLPDRMDAVRAIAMEALE